MQVIFDNKKLVKLYETGECSKYRISKQILEKFFMRIEQLEAAVDIYDLWKTPSLNFEKMKGKKNRYSVRIDRGYRLEFEIRRDNTEKTKGTVILKEISKHYKR